MRVLMVSANFHPYVGGSERQALELSKALAALGHEPVVLTRRLSGSPADEIVEGVTVRRARVFGAGPLNALSFMAAVLAHMIRRLGAYDAVHAHMASSPAVAAAAAARLQGIPVVVKVAGGRGRGEFGSRRSGVLSRLKWAALRFLEVILVAVNGEVLEEIRASGEGFKAALVPNGVDLARFSPAPSRRDELRSRLGWRGTVFLHVGRLSTDARQSEGIEAFLKAWRLAKAGGMAAEFKIAGGGTERERLAELVRAMGLQASVEFLGERADVAEMYRAADVFVLPGYSHGLSNALLEAMAAGLPSLVSSAPGVQGPVADGQEGLGFDLDRPESGRDALLRLSTDPDLRNRMGSKARESVGAYSIEATARKYLELYRQAPVSYGADYARRYREGDDRFVLSEDFKQYRDILEKLTRSFGREIEALDLGCGTGRYFHCLKNVKRLVGVDASPAMLAEARRPAHAEEVSISKIELMNAEVGQYSSPPGSFDFVYSIGLLGYLEPFDAATCGRVFDLLRPGGRALLTAVDRASMPQVRTLQRGLAGAAYPFLPAAMKERLDRRWRSYYVSEAELREALASRPWADIDLRRYESVSPDWRGANFEAILRKGDAGGAR